MSNTDKQPLKNGEIVRLKIDHNVTSRVDINTDRTPEKWSEDWERIPTEKADKHTPLNWGYMQTASRNEIPLSYMIGETSELNFYGKGIARIETNAGNGKYSPEESKANAEMIVKAVNNYPRIIEALKNALPFMIEWRDECVREVESFVGNEAQMMIDIAKDVTDRIEATKKLLSELKD